MTDDSGSSPWPTPSAPRSRSRSRSRSHSPLPPSSTITDTGGRSGNRSSSRIPGYSAVGTLSSAFAGLWSSGSPGGNADGSPARRGREGDDDELGDTRESLTPRVPGGWGSTYLSRVWYAPPSLLFGDSAREGGTSGQRIGETHGEASGSTHRRRRSAIPFEMSPERNARDIRRSVPAYLSPKGSPVSRKVTSRIPLHHEPGESAIATLTRLQAQTSMNSMRTNSMDNSFATVHSTMNGNWEDDEEDQEQEGGQRGEAEAPGSSAWTLAASFNDRSPDLSQVEVSIKPGAPTPTTWAETLARTALLDSYVHTIVYQSGIDYEGRPIVILSSPALPNPKDVDYDALLTRIMDQMEVFVQNEYTVIFFAGGSSYRPPWTWIWNAYRRLSRPFRKNCRRLLICHPTFFTRTLVRIVSTGSAVLSPKFARKITQVDTLSDLAKEIDLTQIDIPPDVLKWNMRYEAQVTIPPRTTGEKPETPSAPGEIGNLPGGVFGVPLEVLMGEKGEKGGIPRVVKDCVEELQRSTPVTLGSGGASNLPAVHNLDTEGLFRKSGSSALLQAAQQAYDRGNPVSLNQYNDANIPACLLKLYFRRLPDPMFPPSMYPLIRKCPPVDDHDEESVREAIIYIQDIIFPAILPQSKLILFTYVLELLHKVSRRSERNKMDAVNLATVWGPNLVKSNDPVKDMAMCAVTGAPKMTDLMGRRTDSRQGASTETSSAASTVPLPTPTTLGTLLKLCIERYYEIFELDYLDYEPPTYHPASLFEEEGQDPKHISSTGPTDNFTPPLVSTHQESVPGTHPSPPSVGSNSTSASGVMAMLQATDETTSFPGSPCAGGVSTRRTRADNNSITKTSGPASSSPWPPAPFATPMSTPVSPSRSFSIVHPAPGSGSGPHAVPRTPHKRMLSAASNAVSGLDKKTASSSSGAGAVSSSSSSSSSSSPAGGGGGAGAMTGEAPCTPSLHSSSSSSQGHHSNLGSHPPTATNRSGSISGSGSGSGSVGHIGGGGGNQGTIGLGFGPLHHTRGLGNPMSVGRSASGSLKLTRARLGSLTTTPQQVSSTTTIPTTTTFSSTSSSASAIVTTPSPLLLFHHSPIIDATTAATIGTTSGVALTGTCALGFVSSGIGATSSTNTNTSMSTNTTTTTNTTTMIGNSNSTSSSPSSPSSSSSSHREAPASKVDQE